MMRRMLLLGVGLVLTLNLSALAGSGVRLGGGAHYWQAIDDIDTDDIDDDGFSYLVSVQAAPADLLRLQADLEVFPDGFLGQSETTYAPQAFVILGMGLYAGLGIGINYADGEFADDPFYVVRAGFDVVILPGLHLDVHGNYQFVEWETIESLDDEIDTDTVTLGAALRIDL